MEYGTPKRVREEQEREREREREREGGRERERESVFHLLSESFVVSEGNSIERPPCRCFHTNFNHSVPVEHIQYIRARVLRNSIQRELDRGVKLRAMKRRRYNVIHDWRLPERLLVVRVVQCQIRVAMQQTLAFSHYRVVDGIFLIQPF